MTKRQSNILLIILVAMGFVALSVFLWFSTERILSMSEAELFENLIGMFRILEGFHPSVATYLLFVSLTVLWIMWIVYLTCCVLILIRWLKERKK